MNRLKRLVVEVHRRSVWQVLGIYLVGSWVGFQVITELTDRVGMPGWVPSFAIVLFIIGLPVVVATAFVQEGLPGPRGERARAPSADGSPAASAVVARAETAAPPVERSAAAPGRAPAKPNALLTWQRSIAAGIVAFLLLGISAASYMGLRQAGVGPFGSLITTGALERRERVLIAELQYPGGDTLLARALTEALRVGLEQSPEVNVVSSAHVRTVLQRMDRAGVSRLDPELAREVALRDGIRVLLSGEILRAGGSWMLSVRLADAASGESYTSLSEESADSTALLAAVERVSKKLRERIGESLRTIRSSERLEAVTTPSLEALRKYSQAEQAVNVSRDLTLAIQLLEEALALDSTFAMAWRKLAVAYQNNRQGRDKMVASLTRAYQYQDRLTDRERYYTIGSYHSYVTEDLERAAAAYRALLEAYPEESGAHNNLAILYGRMRQYERAAEEYALAVAADSGNAVPWVNLARAHQRLGRWDDALETVRAYEARFGTRPEAVAERFFIATSRGDLAGADRVLEEAATLRNLDLTARANFAHARADLANLRGQLRAAERHRAEAVALDLERGNRFAPVLAEVWNGWIDIHTRADPRRAVARVDAALRARPLSGVAPLDRPYLELAEFYARAGEAGRAQELIADYEREVPADQRGDVSTEMKRVRGFVLLSEGRFAEAIRELQDAQATSDCTICGLGDVARAWDAAGQPDSAIVLYERYLTAPWDRRLWWDAYELGADHERLSQLYDAKGDRERAALYAAKLVELWQDADAELQPRVQAARRRLEQLQGPG